MAEVTGSNVVSVAERMYLQGSLVLCSQVDSQFMCRCCYDNSRPCAKLRPGA